MKARVLVALTAGLLVGAADPALDLGEVTQGIPNRFVVSYGPSVWRRVDDQHWLERSKDETESIYKIMGRAKVRGWPGTVVAKIAGDPKKTGNDNDGRFQVFIPDKGDTTVGVLFRHLGRDDNGWHSLGAMQSAE